MIDLKFSSRRAFANTVGYLVAAEEPRARIVDADSQLEYARLMLAVDVGACTLTFIITPATTAVSVTSTPPATPTTTSATTAPTVFSPPSIALTITYRVLLLLASPLPFLDPLPRPAPLHPPCNYVPTISESAFPPALPLITIFA